MTFVWVSDDSNYSAVSSDSFTQPALNFKKLEREEVWGEWKLYHMAWPHFVPYETGHRNLGEVEGGNLSPKSVDIKRTWVPPHWGQLCKSTVFWHRQLEKWRGAEINEKQKVGYEREQKCGPGYARTEGSRLEEPWKLSVKSWTQISISEETNIMAWIRGHHGNSRGSSSGMKVR